MSRSKEIPAAERRAWEGQDRHEYERQLLAAGKRDKEYREKWMKEREKESQEEETFLGSASKAAGTVSEAYGESELLREAVSDAASAAATAFDFAKEATGREFSC